METRIKVHSYKNLDCPPNVWEGKGDECRVGSGYVAASEVLGLKTDQNIRGMLADKRSSLSRVHREMMETLHREPSLFSVLNGGLTIVAKSFSFSQKDGVISLESPSIINGAQTQGVLQLFKEEEEEAARQRLLDCQEGRVFKDGEAVSLDGVFVRYEIVISKDDDLMSRVSVTRNSQNSVQFLSILGKLGCLNGLKESMSAFDSKLVIRMKETDEFQDEEKKVPFVDTERLIQILVAMAPRDLVELVNSEIPKTSSKKMRNTIGEEGEDDANMKHFPPPYYSYRLMMALRAFQHAYADREGVRKPIYDFFMDIAPQAWELCSRWQSDASWGDMRTEAGGPIRAEAFRKKKRKVKVGGKWQDEYYYDIDKGVMFPILHALSEFCERGKDGKWSLSVPSWFDQKEFRKKVIDSYKLKFKNDPTKMGRSPDSYEDLRQWVRFQKTNVAQRIKIQELEEALSRAKAKR